MSNNSPEYLKQKPYSRTPNVAKDTRQTLRSALRKLHGHAPGNREWREMRGLPEVKDRDASFCSHLFGPVDAK